MTSPAPQTGAGEIVLGKAALKALRGFKNDRSELLEALAALANLTESRNEKEDHTGSRKTDDNDLAGWRIRHYGKRRLIYRIVPSGNPSLEPSIEVIHIGKKNEGDEPLYKTATAIAKAYASDPDQQAAVTDMWQALDALDTAAHDIGLDSWDVAPARDRYSEGFRYARESLAHDGSISLESTDYVSDDEVNHALYGRQPAIAEAEAALDAALKSGGDGEAEATLQFELEARTNADWVAAAIQRQSSGLHNPAPIPPLETILQSRRTTRCGRVGVRSLLPCARPSGHVGPCRYWMTSPGQR